LFGCLETARVLGGGVGALVSQLLDARNKCFVERQGLGALDSLDITVECVLDQRAHDDDAFCPDIFILR
jgi:hypothetical protein